MAACRRIEILPTMDEILSFATPYLPPNLPGAPHHLPAESPERLLDIQFRLLRHDLTAEIIQNFQGLVMATGDLDIHYKSLVENAGLSFCCTYLSSM
jgi:hypothetical protein